MVRRHEQIFPQNPPSSLLKLPVSLVWVVALLTCLAPLYAEGDGSSTVPISETISRPIEFRSLFVSFGLSPDQPFDRPAWEARLSKHAEEGYNTIIWLVGSEVWAGGHKLIRWNEFPEARELSPEDNEKCISEFQWLLAAAKERGLDNYLYTTMIYFTPAFAKAHGLDKEMLVSDSVTPSHNAGVQNGSQYCGVRNELTRSYMESMICEFVQTYDDLDGFYGALGEALPGDRASFYREAIVPGLKRSGRNARFIVHQWQVPMPQFMKEIVEPAPYENTWLGIHTYNGEQMSDAKPYPGTVEWVETTGLSTVVAVYPSNVQNLPFNSPRYAFEVVREMSKVQGIEGFMYWEMSRVQMSDLFREAIAYYAKTGETYSEEPWLAQLEAQFGTREAAKGFLHAFNVSGRIIPELCALVYHPADVQRRELRLPYRFMTGNNGPDSWMTSPARGRILIPIPIYARFAAAHRRRFYKNNGAAENYQEAIWSSHGGSVFDIIPEDHLETIRLMGDEAFAAADGAMKHVTMNKEEAQRVLNFMKAYKLLAHYYEQKTLAAISALIYAQNHENGDRVRAERYADESLRTYKEFCRFLHDEVNPQNKRMIGIELSEAGVTPEDLLKAEIEERSQLPQIFSWPVN